MSWMYTNMKGLTLRPCSLFAGNRWDHMLSATRQTRVGQCTHGTQSEYDLIKGDHGAAHGSKDAPSVQ